MSKLMFALLSICVVTHASEPEDFFTYKVNNNLPLFVDGSDSEDLKKTAQYSQYYFSSDVNEIPKKINPWIGRKIFPKTFFNDSKPNYTKSYIFPESQEIVLNAVENASKCEWKINDDVLLDTSCKNVKVLIKFNEKKPTYYEASADISLSINGEKIQTKKIISRDYIIAALGDSYASGEGTPDMPMSQVESQSMPAEDTPDVHRRWWFKTCHRSLLAWPSLAVASIAARNPQNSYRFVSRACSGALIADIGYKEDSLRLYDKHKTGKGEFGRENVTVSQVALLEDDLVNKDKSRRQPILLLLSAGGNDAHFSKIIVKTFSSSVVKKNELKNEYKRKLEKDKKYVSPALVSLANNILDKFPATSVIHAIYPEPLHRNKDLLCMSGKSGNFSDHGTKYRGLGVLGKGFDSVSGITNQEVIALFEDFIVPFTGSSKATPDHEYQIGLSQWSSALSKKLVDEEKKPKWGVLLTRKNCNGCCNSDTKTTSEHKCVYKQIDGYQSHGFCVTGKGYEGAWFNNYNDSEQNQGDRFGAIHPNLYGQLYYINRLFKDYPSLMLSDFSLPLRSE